MQSKRRSTPGGKRVRGRIRCHRRTCARRLPSATVTSRCRGERGGRMLTQGQLAGEGLWVVFTIATYWATYAHRSLQPASGTSQYTGVMVMQCVGCYFVGKHRGRSGWWGLVGLFSFLCLALPWLLPFRDAPGMSLSKLAVRIGCAVTTIVVALGVLAMPRLLEA